jgi:integrase
MPSGAAVIRYDGKRGVVFYVKYRDASGRQIKERLGPTSEGWSRRKAEAELRARLVAVDREGYRRPEPTTFKTFALAWLADYPEAKSLKRSTRRGYDSIVNRHLVPAFGTLQLGDVTVERIERHLAGKRRGGLSGATLNRQLNVLSLVMGAALRRGLVRANPVALVERPREARRKWRILSPAEVGAVERAFDELIGEAENDRNREDRRTVRVLFLTFMGTGVRHGEVLGLRWRAVLLADPDGPVMRVEETFVRSAIDTPKSDAGHRTIALGPRLAAELFDHRSVSPFDGDDERVFANPRTGHAFDPNRYAAIIRLAYAKAGIDGYVRPAHDLRHSSITNAAAAGTPPEALMTRAGHSSYATTRRYVDLAGERFRSEADRLEERLWGKTGTEKRYQVGDSSPEQETEVTAERLG